jgi:hypothetical protein
MSDLKKYKATINGIDHEFLLNDADATTRGLDPAKDAVQEEDLAVTPLDFGTPTTDGEQVEANVAADLEAAATKAELERELEAKSRTTANKSRTTATKASE